MKSKFVIFPLLIYLLIFSNVINPFNSGSSLNLVAIASAEAFNLASFLAAIRMRQLRGSQAAATLPAGRYSGQWQLEISTYGRPVTLIWPQTHPIDGYRFRSNIDAIRKKCGSQT